MSHAEAPVTGRRWWTWPLTGTVAYLAAGVTAELGYRIRTEGGHSPWGKGTGPMLVILPAILVLAVGLIPLVCGWAVAVRGTRAPGRPAPAAAVALCWVAVLFALVAPLVVLAGG